MGVFEGMAHGDVVAIVIDRDKTMCPESYCMSFCEGRGCKYLKGEKCIQEEEANKKWEEILKEQEKRAEKQHLKLEVKE